MSWTNYPISNNLTAQNITGNIKTNSISSIGANDDLVIDAQGAGKIKLQTLINGGVELSSVPSGSNANWIALAQATAGSDRALVSGSFYAGEWQPTIGGHAADYSGWMPLWINPGQMSIFGQVLSTTASANTNRVYISGNAECSGIMRCSSLVVGSTAVFAPAYLSLIDTNTQAFPLATASYVIFASVVLNTGFTITNNTTWVCNATGIYKFSITMNGLTGVTDLRILLEVNAGLIINGSAAQYSNSITSLTSDFLYSLTAADSIRVFLLCNTTAVSSNNSAGYPIRKLNILRVA